MVNDIIIDPDKSLSFFERHYMLLKIHYFVSYSSLASIGPVLNIILRGRGLNNLEISYINVIIPFLVFFTNPILGYFVDHSRHFRLTFNLTFGLASILFVIMFYLPSIEKNNIHGEIYEIEKMKYSMNFCTNKDFNDRCALRSKCGCDCQVICKSLLNKNNFKEKFNFTINSKYVEKQFNNISIFNNERSICQINYRVSIDEIINKNKNSFNNTLLNKDLKLANCEIKCSISEISNEKRKSNEIISVILYSFLIILGLNLFANATTIGTSFGFFILHDCHLFGEQRVFGTIGFGLFAFLTSRLYAYFKSDYVYILTFIITSIISIIITTLIHPRSNKILEIKSEDDDDDDISVLQNLNNSSINKKNEQTKVKNNSLNIVSLLRLMKKIDVIILLSTTFIWGMSSGGIDPYLLLYIDEIYPCESHSIIGYISLITSTFEVIALFIANKLLKHLGTKILTILIFIAFIIRFSGYYLIDQPYLFLPFETMHFFTFGILFVLIAQEAFEIAPPDLIGTFQSIVYGISFGLGRGIGLFVSSLIYTQMKKKDVFLFYIIFNIIGIIIYLFYCLLSKGNKTRRRRSSIVPVNTLTKSEKVPIENILLSSMNNEN